MDKWKIKEWMNGISCIKFILLISILYYYSRFVLRWSRYMWHMYSSHLAFVVHTVHIAYIILHPQRMLYVIFIGGYFLNDGSLLDNYTMWYDRFVLIFQKNVLHLSSVWLNWFRWMFMWLDWGNCVDCIWKFQRFYSNRAVEKETTDRTWFKPVGF